MMARLRNLAVALLATAAVSGLAAMPAGAHSLDASGTHIVAFSDTDSSPLPTLLPFTLTQLKAQYCSGRGDRGSALSLGAALRAARRLADADSLGHGVSAFAHSKEGKTENRAMATAAGALGRGKPAAALAALLRAHALAPRDAAPLIDMAPLLSQAGKGRAALGVLDGAERLKAPKTQPFGITWKAVSTANRGQALIVTRRYAAAEKTLNAALKATPLLREAEQNLAVDDDCQGKQDQAKKFLVAAARRQTFARTDYVGVSNLEPFGQLNAAEVLDTSRGQQLTLPTFTYPKTMDEGRAQHQAWAAREDELTQTEMPVVNAKQNADWTALNTELEKSSPAAARRTRDILTAITGAGLEPDIAPLAARSEKLQRRVSQLQLQGYGQMGCINAGLHETFLATVQDYDTAQRAYAVALYRRQTALAANLRDPLAHQVGLDIANHDVPFNLFSIVNEGLQISIYDQICDPNHGSVPAENPESGQQQTPASPACPTGIGGPDWSLSLLVFSVSVTCEEATFDAEIGEGWLNGFASVTHNFTKGSNTIYAGAQAGAKVEIGPLSGGATARGGVYVTFGADGSMQDIGLRATTSESATVTPVQASVSGPEASISLVGVFSSPSL